MHYHLVGFYGILVLVRLSEAESDGCREDKTCIGFQ